MGAPSNPQGVNELIYGELSPADRDALLSGIARDSLVAIVTIDSSGRFVEVNPAAERLFGYRRADVVGLPMAELMIPAELRPAHAKGLAHYLRTGEGPILGQRVEIEALRVGGDRIPIELEVTAVKSGTQVYFTAFVRDLSERVRNEAELRAAQIQAEADSAAKSRFLASMSHELRTPLTAIMGFADLLQRRAGDPGQRRAWPRQIWTSAQHLLTLLNDLLDLSKLEAGEVTLEQSEINVLEVLDDVVGLIGPLAVKANLDFLLEFDPLLPERVTLDPLRFKQVLVNLLGNAIKFTPAGSVHLLVGLSSDQTELVVRVKDSGLGIPAAQLQTIFDPFVQVHDAGLSQRGTGLGLEISRRLAELLGGALSVESEVGVGSEFSFRLPLQDSKLVSITELRVESEETKTREFSRQALAGVRVLVADDHDAIRSLLRILFEEQGAVVEDVVDGRAAVAAVAKARDEGRPFDVACFDMQMPVLDGAQAVKEIREAGDQLPVVALTAHAMLGDRSTCLAAGYNAYLSKPIQAGLLTQTVADLALSSPRPLPPPEASLPTSAPTRRRQLQVDPRFIEFARDFQRGLVEVRETLSQAESAGDSEVVRGEAHKLAGVAETYGFKELGDAGRGVDQALKRDPDLAGAARLLLELQRCLDRALDSELRG